jgi:hypothetical protein
LLLDVIFNHLRHHAVGGAMHGRKLTHHLIAADIRVYRQLNGVDLTL